jgi:hypothetical protein
MRDLNFHIEGAEAVPFGAIPLLSFKLRISGAPADMSIHTVALRAQIQIDATRRKYTAQEQEKLRDLFGDPGSWSRTLRPMLWTHANVVIPQFSGQTLAELQIPCTFDFNVAATKYFHALEAGDLPLIFLFSGTVFYADRDGSLQVAPISWDKEAKFRLRVETWRGLIESYYPNTAWLTLRKDVFERLYQYKVRSGIPTFEQALDRVLAAVEQPVET